MQIQSMNQIQNMYQNQVNQNQGKAKGMGQVMKTLTPEQRKELSSILQNMPQEDKKSIVEQIKSLDVNSLSQDELYNSIMNILNPSQSSTEINLYA